MLTFATLIMSHFKSMQCIALHTLSAGCGCGCVGGRN